MKITQSGVKEFMQICHIRMEIATLYDGAMSDALCFNHEFIVVILEWPAVKTSRNFDLAESYIFQ